MLYLICSLSSLEVSTSAAFAFENADEMPYFVSRSDDSLYDDVIGQMESRFVDPLVDLVSFLYFVQAHNVSNEHPTFCSC